MNEILPKKKVESFKEEIDETSMALRKLTQEDWSLVRKKCWNTYNFLRLKFIELN